MSTAPASPSPSQPLQDADLPTQNPNSPHDDDDQHQHQPENHSQPPSPETKTLESSHPQNPEQSDLNQTQNQQDDDQDDLQVLDQDGDQHNRREPEDHAEQSGMSTLSPPPALIPPIPEPQDSNPTPITSPTIPSRRVNKRKKGTSKKKLQAIEKKLQTLFENLRPIPFVPSKTLDFDKHEKLLKRLGLWDFVHIEFDRNIRHDLIAQLIANYDPRLRSSYVNEFRIAVNRADLARAFKLPVKKDKGSVSALSSEAVDLDLEAFSEESIAFIDDFVSNWVLLHEDTWLMPNEVLNWTRAIKDGHPEKVDWAGLLWFMVEKELMQGQSLEDCYYASHLQQLIKSQREEVFFNEPRVELEVDREVEPDPEPEVEPGPEPEPELNPEPEPEGEPKQEVEAEADAEAEVDAEAEAEAEAEVDAEAKAEVEVKVEEDVGAGTMGELGASDDFQGEDEHDKVMVGEPNVELTLGQEIVEKGGAKDVDMMDIEETKEGEQGNWLLDGKNNMGDHILQPCNMEDDRVMDADEERKPEEDEEEEEEEEEEAEDDGFNLTPKDHTIESGGLTGNLLQGMETSQISFGLPGQLRDQSNMELLASRSETHTHTNSVGPSIFGNGSKRDIGHDHDISHDSLNMGNKRLRTDGPWDQKLSDFETCVEQVHHWIGKARMMYEEKDQAIEELNMNQQLLFEELQRRGNVIENLQKTQFEEQQKKDAEIYRLERELYMMGSVLDGYRKALKETHRAFSEYRQRCQLPEEPLYKDAGPGGIVLSNMELEKQRLKREEEDRLNRLMLEQKMKEVEDASIGKLEGYANEVEKLDKMLMDFENEVKLLKEIFARRKISGTPECALNDG